MLSSLTVLPLLTALLSLTVSPLLALDKINVKELQNLCGTYDLFTGDNKKKLSNRLQRYFKKKREKLQEKLQEDNVEAEELSKKDVNDFNEKISADKLLVN
ncbi:6347_t:CDS:2 [Cetraspora pellucida]|uniref:6347_t:CDS:1 n=1 Tax=Cetraspora pellucida TaxID=1433469 RepID=A0A9N9JZL2_9GLOM|nr:6347_t:CDS:2 [Cetraspora pellucida]